MTPTTPPPRCHRRLLRRRRRAAGPRGGGGAGPAPERPRVISPFADWGRPRIRWTVRLLHAGVLLGLVVIGLGPLLLLAKFAITPTQDILHAPMALFPHGLAWQNLWTAWSDIHLDLYFRNTVVLAIGSWLIQLLVATTGGFALSVLRPRYAKPLTGLVLCTLFVPAVVLLVPLYLTILDPPLLHRSLINTYWAVWLPAGASAFNVVLVKRFFDNLPREIFEAAQVDGAGPVPAVLVDRAADVAADPRRGLGVRGDRLVEGLPLAAAGAA